MKPGNLIAATAVLLLALGSIAGKCNTGPKGPGGGGGGESCGAVGEACCKHDHCELGGACNMSTKICDEVSTAQCGGIGAACCAPSSTGPTCSASTCDGSVCQPCGGDGQLCCQLANIAECSCAPGFEASGDTCVPM